MSMHAIPAQESTISFEDLVITDAYGRTSDAQATVLRSDQCIVAFDDTLRALIGRIEGQLAEDNARHDAGEPLDPQWRRRTVRLLKVLRERRSEIRPLAAAARRRANGGQP